MSRRDWFDVAAQLICTAGCIFFAYRLLSRGRTQATRRA